MGVKVKELIPSKTAENAQTTQYTATDCKAVIDKFTATNTDASAVVVLSVNLVPLAGTAGASNLVANTRQIGPYETYSFPELSGQVLQEGSFISTLAGTAGVLTIRCSGREITGNP